MSAALGVQTREIDLRTTPGPALAAQLRLALARHHLLVFRRQRVDAAQLAAFGRLWGQLDDNRPHPSLAELPEVFPISNDAAHGHLNTGQYWHSDGVYQVVPATVTILFGERVPAGAGGTAFCNAHLAYEALVEDRRRFLEGLTGYHVNRNRRALCISHPVTGRRALYANLGSTAGFVDPNGRYLKPSERDEVFAEIDALYSRPALGYAHTYEEGDVLVYDNFALSHRGLSSTSTELRRVLRVTALCASVQFTASELFEDVERPAWDWMAEVPREAATGS